MSYKAPNPYVEKVPFKGKATTSKSNSIMGIIGITPNGATDKAVLVTSWTEFIEKFAMGISTPFMANAVLSHAVYGFFQNGGSQLYVARVVGTNSKKAEVVLAETTVKVMAKNEGEWGNSIKITVDDSGDADKPYLFNVYYSDVLVESFMVANSVTSSAYFESSINTNSEYVSVSISGSADNYTLKKIEDKVSLSGGADDLTSITDKDYTDRLTKFDSVHNLAAVGIPGQTTSSVVKALIDYTKNKPVLPVLEFPETSVDAATIIAFAKANCAKSDTVLYGPCLTIVDPLSASSKTKGISCVGHMMGVIARTIDTKGEWNAAAGTEAVVNGVLGVETVFTDEDRGKLNEAGVNIILTKPNYGTVVWGARSQSDDPELKYESNLTLNHTLRRNIDDAMQRFEFKNNGPSLWVDVTAEITGLMETKRLAGAFAGATPETCYYVKCDETNNTQATIDKGQVIVEVGYAANKPAEFIIVRVAHQISN